MTFGWATNLRVEFVLGGVPLGKVTTVLSRGTGGGLAPSNSSDGSYA